MGFLPIRKPNVSRYLAKSVEIIFIFEPWTFDFDESWNPRFMGTKLRVSKFPTYWWTENAISSDSWNQYFLHFDGL